LLRNLLGEELAAQAQEEAQILNSVSNLLGASVVSGHLTLRF
jgi:hypothetical protein